MSKKLRIAVSLSGMARNFKQCYKNTLEFFNVEGAEVDFFIHSWTNNWYPIRAKSEKKSPSTSRKLDYQDLYEALSEHYNPKNIIIEDQLANLELARAIKSIRDNLLRDTSSNTIPSWLVKLLKENETNKFLSSPLHLAQTYSISKSAELVSDYSKENDINYDLVFRFRFDNFMELKTKEYRTKIFNDMVCLMERDLRLSEKVKKFKRNHLFTAWTSVFGEGGFARNSVWIGDKIFASSGRDFYKFKEYFRTQLIRILTYNPSIKNTNHESPYFMPEGLLAQFCIDNDFFSNSMGYLNLFSLVSYREYHLDLEQSFEALQLQYNKRERMNHDSTDGLFIENDC